MGSVLRIVLFGTASFSIGGHELRFKSLKLRAALGYIALNESLTETREKLIALLWTEASKDHARASLRQIIRELRIALQASNYDGLHIAVREIGFAHGSVEVDVWAVIRSAEQGRVHPFLLERGMLTDELLAGLDDLDPSFRSWLQAKRRSIRDRLLRALENAMAAENGDHIMQGNVARAILNLDPTHEDAACRLMRARAMMGDTAGALRVYGALWTLLEKDHGRRPGDTVQRLIADIKAGVLEPTFTATNLAVPQVSIPSHDPTTKNAKTKRLSYQPSISPSIYDRWLRCQTLASNFNPLQWEDLRQEFSRITVEAPNFGPAYIGLADLHNTKHIFHPGLFRSHDSEQTALNYAQRAVELNPFDQRANRTLAWSHLMAKQYDQAVRQMEVAYELNPDDAWNVISVAIMKAIGGQPEAAAELAQLALDMTLVPSPTHWTYQITIQYFVANYAAAITAADRSLNAAAGSLAWRAAALAQLGRMEEAGAAATGFINRIRANWLGNEPPTDWAITKWMLHLSPMKRREDWEHLRDGLAKASLPVDAIEYDDV